MKYLLLTPLLLLLTFCTTIPDQASIMEDFKNQTGLQEIATPSGQGTYLGKTYEGLSNSLYS